MYVYLRKTRLKKAYKKLFREFLQNSTFHGLREFLYKTIIPYGRKLWLLFLTVLIVWTHYLIINLAINYLEQPTEIHLSTNLIHVANSPFPALAICSSNKFSKSKMLEFAEKVFKAQQSFKPNLLADNSSAMVDHLIVLAGFYVLPYDNLNLDDERIQKLHDILSFMFEKVEAKNFTDYPSRDILRNLGPACEDLTIRASVFGRPWNISDLFYKRITSTGVCCMFNYRRKSYANDPEQRKFDDNFAKKFQPIKFESCSVLNNVAFVLQSNPEDFIYKELSNDAFQLHLFPPNDYAMIQSTTGGDVLIDHNTIVEIPIQPRFFEADYSIRPFPPSVRYCYFPEEGQKMLNLSYYSIDECLVICRMKSQVKYCGCVNPTLPGPLVNASYCNLLDLPCLSRWKSVWYGWHNFDYVYSEQQHEQNTNIENCAYCMPTCEIINYRIQVNVVPLRATMENVYSFGILKGLSNEKPLAVVELFFQNIYEQANQNVIVDDWIDLLNRFGGIMSLMYGFSFVSIVEIYYFFSGKWFVYFYKIFKAKQQLKTSNRSSIYTLYWKELQPKYLTNQAVKFNKRQSVRIKLKK